MTAFQWGVKPSSDAGLTSGTSDSLSQSVTYWYAAYCLSMVARTRAWAYTKAAAQNTPIG